MGRLCSLYLSQSVTMGVKEGPDLLWEVLNYPIEQFKCENVLSAARSWEWSELRKSPIFPTPR